MHGYWKANKAHITRYWSITAELIKAGIAQFTLRSIDLILFRIRRNCQRNGKSKSLCLFIRRSIEESVVIIESCHLWIAWNISSNILLSGFNIVRRGNYWGSSVWISKQQVNCWSYILHASNTYLITYLLTYLLTYSMEQRPYWEANRYAASQEIPHIVWNPKVHYLITSDGHMSLSWPCSIQSIPPHPISWRSMLILSSHLRLGLPSGLILSGFPTKTLYTPLLSPLRATCPAHLIILDFFTRTILGEKYRS